MYHIHSLRDFSGYHFLVDGISSDMYNYERAAQKWWIKWRIDKITGVTCSGCFGDARRARGLARGRAAVWRQGCPGSVRASPAAFSPACSVPCGVLCLEFFHCRIFLRLLPFVVSTKCAILTGKKTPKELNMEFWTQNIFLWKGICSYGMKYRKLIITFWWSPEPFFVFVKIFTHGPKSEENSPTDRKCSSVKCNNN